MNERIKLISDTEVEVQRNCAPTCITKFRIFTTDVNYIRVVSMKEGDGNWYDELGNDAELEVRQCWKDTGSFAALSDESAVPYVGERMRWQTADDGIHEITVLEIYGNSCRIHSHKNDFRSYPPVISCLLPLVTPTPPVKKYRPLTPVEALQHFGRKILSKNHKNHPKESHYLYSVYPEGVYWDSCRMASFEMLLEHYVWADTKEPCGVEEA